MRHNRRTLPLPLLLILFAVIGAACVSFGPHTSAQALHMQPSIYTKSTHQCTQQQVIRSLLKPGMLEIWNTGSTSVPANSLFDPHRYATTIPAGKPLFTGMDLDPASLSTGQDAQTGYYYINFSMKKAPAAKLVHFTTNNIGKYITITLDRIVVSSPMIAYTLPGKGQFQMSPRSFKLLGIKCSISS